MQKRTIVMAITGSLLLSSLAAVVSWKTAQGTHDETKALNPSIQQQASGLGFAPLYYKPAVRAIGGYSYQAGSLSVTRQLLGFRLSNASGKTITVTEQARPAEGLDVDAYKGRLQLNVATGRAIVGGNKNNTSAAIFGEKTVVFIKADYVVDDATLQAMLAAFSQ
jgi:hypothetical protein